MSIFPGYFWSSRKSCPLVTSGYCDLTTFYLPAPEMPDQGTRLPQNIPFGFSRLLRIRASAFAMTWLPRANSGNLLRSRYRKMAAELISLPISVKRLTAKIAENAEKSTSSSFLKVFLARLVIAAARRLRCLECTEIFAVKALWLYFSAHSAVNRLSSYRLNKSPTACFITAPPTSEIERVSGISFGHASTQFCAYPHSWIPPSPIRAASRSRFRAAPVGWVLNRRTCEIVAAPTNPVSSLNCGQTSIQQQHEIQLESGYACSCSSMVRRGPEPRS